MTRFAPQGVAWTTKSGVVLIGTVRSEERTEGRSCSCFLYKCPSKTLFGVASDFFSPRSSVIRLPSDSFIIAVFLSFIERAFFFPLQCKDLASTRL